MDSKPGERKRVVKSKDLWGTWLAPLVEWVTLDLKVVG